MIATSARDDERLAKAVSVHRLHLHPVDCVRPDPRRSAGGEDDWRALYVETRPARRALPRATLAAFAHQAGDRD